MSGGTHTPWGVSTVADVALLEMGQSPDGQATNTDGKGIPLIGGAADYKEGRIEASRYTTEPRKVCREGDLILCIRATIGKVAVADKPYCLGRGVAGLRPSKVTPDFLRYFLNSQANAMDEAGTGTTFRQIDKKTLASWPVPLPEPMEQRRIVAKLDILFNRSKSARQELDHIPHLVERYKNAILTAAFRGNFVGENAARWPTATLGDLIAGIDSGKNVRCEERPPGPSERGIVKVSSVTWGTFDPLASKTPPSTELLDRHTLIQSGDFLISRANTLELVGACVIVGPISRSNLYLSDKVLRIRFTEPVDEWVLYFLRSAEGRRQIEGTSNGNQFSMRNISQASLKAIRLPLPSQKIRKCTLDRIKKQLEVISDAYTEAIRAYNLLDRLDQATLAKAFHGELVSSSEP
jgi:type I restriction enzyme, S subunit